MKKQKLLIYGAGAIGRGYVPWLFPSEGYDLFYVESAPALQNLLQNNKTFATHKTVDNGYVKQTVHVEACFSPGEEMAHLDMFNGVITAVGPRNVLSLKDVLKVLNVPVLLLENDMNLADKLRRLCENPNIYFGIPDVITSNTAPASLLKENPLSIVTEDGVCFSDENAASFGGNITYLSAPELNRQWLAKLYIHNTPHCIAAYLGSLCGRQYLHEAMMLEPVCRIVKGAMDEMCSMLENYYSMSREFVQWYKEKELSRFGNTLLYDPLARVAREPFRKLEADNRLIGAAQLALSCGIMPVHVLRGIIAAFMYEQEDDPDFNISYLHAALDAEDFLQLIIELQPSEALYQLLIRHWPEITTELKEIKNVASATA